MPAIAAFGPMIPGSTIARKAAFASSASCVCRKVRCASMKATVYVARRRPAASRAWGSVGSHPALSDSATVTTCASSSRIAPARALRVSLPSTVSMKPCPQDGTGVFLDTSAGQEASRLVAATRQKIRSVAVDMGPSMLIRPDACIAWAGEENDTDGLEDALCLWFIPTPDDRSMARSEQ
jgi:hypothetical protein